ncbi:hypothetical protein GQ600_6016 [Phytophthora cactorum]|nr:hypothetical protein GQ600_6016 [Phytophthora cactorum]
MSNDVENRENTGCGWKSGIPGRIFLMSLRRNAVAITESACCWSVPSNAVGTTVDNPDFFWCCVSFILVYVNNQEKDYPFSGFSKLLPSNVFHHSNSKTQPCAMIPVYISLREDNKDNPPNRKKKSKKAKLAGYTPSLRCVCQPLQGPEDRPRAWSFLSSTASACLENIVNSAWWDVEERVRSDLENATSPTHRLRELLESTRHSIPFKRRVKGKKRKRKRSTGFTKGINEKKRKL